MVISACDSGWISYGRTSHCYRHIPSRMSWDTARSYCKSISPPGKIGDLASVMDRNTNTFLSTMTTKEVWTGGYQDENNKWFWSDGTKLKFTAWSSGQPSGGNQKHVTINFKTPGGWNDANANSEREFLCQYFTGIKLITLLPNCILYSYFRNNSF